MAQEIASLVRIKLETLEDSGVDLDTFGSPSEIATAMIGRLGVIQDPQGEPVGRCYTSGTLQAELGVTRAAVSKAVKELRILRLRTAQRTNLYPAFQIRDGQVLPGLERVLRVLSLGTSDTWEWAVWLCSRADSAEGEPLPRRIDQLSAGDIHAVTSQAWKAVDEWAE